MKSSPPRLRVDRLWRRLAEAQDAAVQRDSLPAPHPAAGRRPHPRPFGRVALVLGAAAAGMAVLAYHRPPRDAGQALVADARTDLPLRFADGSTLSFRAGSKGRMRRLGDDGAEVFLDRGRLEAHVVHARATLWLVHAGPYRVRVTGTHFALGWSEGRFDVALFEGAVVIDGAVLGAGVPLAAGHRLTVDGGIVRTELLAEAEVDPSPSANAAPPPPPGASDVLPPRSRPEEGGDWQALAKQGAYDAAFAAAKRVGWARLCHRLDARPLLMLGDVARYTDAGGPAREAFEALVTRFPHDQLAADAEFSLGRLAFESREPDRAARWFRRYVDDWPRGALADQAAGRLLECAVDMHDAEAARSAARAYLARAPGGPHADMAHKILRDGAP